jgi:hypothetical protein
MGIINSSNTKLALLKSKQIIKWHDIIIMNRGEIYE